MNERLRQVRARIDALRPLNAFITLTGEVGDGDMVAVEDVIDVAGLVTSCGARLPGATAAGRDAAVVARARAAGALIVGKTNLEPWAFGVTSNNPHWGDVRHPIDPLRSPGGSSGGAAVAVAAGLCNWAMGTDTGGSVRLPAALCGVVGLKPSWGLVQLTGVAPLAPSLDTLGIFAPDLATAMRALAVVAGRPDLAELSQHQEHAPLHLATPAGWVGELDSAVGDTWMHVLPSLVPVVLPERKQLARTAMTILLHEAYAVHASRLGQHPQVFTAALRESLLRGAAISAQDHAVALQARVAARQAVEQAMAGYDALVLPTADRVAPLRGAPIAPGSLTRFTMPFNLTGQPAISLPAATTGLPTAIQLVGRFGQDAALLVVASRFVRALRQP